MQLKRSLIFVATISLLLLAWQVMGSDTSSIPLPTNIISEFSAEFNIIRAEAAHTINAAALGFLFAFSAATISAVLLAVWPESRSLILPLSIVIQVTPKVAIAPILFIILTGQFFPKAALAGIISFFPLLIALETGLRDTRVKTDDLVNQFQISRLAALFHIQVPMVTPWLLAALKVSLVYALIGAITAEFVQPGNGLGDLVLRAEAVLNRDLMFAAVFATSIIGLAVWLIAELFERACLRLMGVRDVRQISVASA